MALLLPDKDLFIKPAMEINGFRNGTNIGSKLECRFVLLCLTIGEKLFEYVLTI